MRCTVTVTIYTRGEKMGEAQIPILTTNKRELRQQLAEAIQAAAHAQKQLFDLPEPENLSLPDGYDSEMFATFLQGNGMHVASDIHKQVRSLEHEEARIAQLEVLTEASTFRVMNSNGIDISYHKTSVHVESVMTAGDAEFLASTLVVSPAQLDLPFFFAEQARITADAAIAERCEDFEGDVLLSGRSLLEVLAPTDGTINPLLLHANARMKILGLSRFTMGQPVGVFEGEPFTISTNPVLAQGLFTVPVDEDGTPLRLVSFIRTGIFSAWIASARDAQYIGVPRTGHLSNIHVSDGATREEHLRGNNYVEIVSFSWFIPDAYSGDFSAEIRLGYRWLLGKKTPFRGGHLIGNMFTNMCNARFSREVMQEAHYYGPRAILFKNAVVKRQE